ncbi:NAD(P)H-binding protein [Olsenella uli]|uniref:NAD(P)H-binding protein n=1 Tax=Olsenella uli TaxID=133926 RepID=UPI00195BAAE8|nr:NAD(P)H-binding protein [Olsenella uli]MBM6675685.1 NAD(P)H-binding protein [Olsenella uli]
MSEKNLKIAVVAANGRVGQLVVREALERGLDVTAVVRGENRTAAEKSLVKDALALTAADLAGFDVVVDAAGGWTPETIPAITNVAVHLADCVAGTSTRLVVVGGAGSLFVNPEHTATVDQGPDFPEDWKPLSAAHGAALANLRERTDVSWTYISPAADFQADGARTSAYTLAGEELTLNAAGASTVSYADYAIAIVDLVESGEHVRERVSVVSK